MSDTMTLLIVAVFVSVVFCLIYLMERRAKTEGAMFTRPTSPAMRMLALLLGLVFAGVFLWDIASSWGILHFVFPILSIALLSYSVVAESLLRRLQGSKSKTNSEPYEIGSTVPQPLRLWIIFIVGIVAIVIVFYVCVWSLAHPTEGMFVVEAVIAGFLLLIVLHYVSEVIKWYKKLRN